MNKILKKFGAKEYVFLAIFMSVLFTFLFIPEVRAGENDITKINKPYDIKISCTVGSPERIPTSSATLNITISNPDGSTLVNNGAATSQGQGLFNYTFIPSTYGYHQLNYFCYDGSNGNMSSSDYILVNYDGMKNSYIFQLIILLIMVALFVLAFNREDPTILALSNLAMFILAFWLIFYGFAGYKDNMIEGIGIVLMGFAFYTSYKVYEEYSK